MEVTAFYLGILFDLPLSSSVPSTLGRGLVLAVISSSIRSCGSTPCLRPARHIQMIRDIYFPRDDPVAPADAVVTSAQGSMVNAHNHIHAPLVAVS